MRRCGSLGHGFELFRERRAACGNPLPRLATAAPDSELFGAQEVWERLEILGPSFGVADEALTLDEWLVSAGDVVEPGQPVARIARADGSRIEQPATSRMRVIECLVASGGLMEPKSRMLVLGPVTPDRDSPRQLSAARADRVVLILSASLGALLLLGS